MGIQAFFSLAKAQDPSPDKALPEPRCLSKLCKTGSHGSVVTTTCHDFKSSLVADLPRFYRELKDFGCQCGLCKETIPLPPVCKPIWSRSKHKPVRGGPGAPICWRGIKSDGDGVCMWGDQQWEEPSSRRAAGEGRSPSPAALGGEHGDGSCPPPCTFARPQPGWEERAERCVHACAPPHTRFSNS